MINESIGDEDSFRKCVDGSKGILKFNTKYPNTMSGFTKYNNVEIIQFLKDNALAWERN